MKILPILLINLVVTGGALVIYDQMQDEGPQTTYEMGGGLDPVTLTDIETRLDRLERDEGQPMLASDMGDSLRRRVEALERRAGGSAAVRPAGDEGSEGPSDAPSTASTGPGPIFSEESGITEDDVTRFRQLMDAANEQRRLEREREQVTNMLARLDITMDEKQKDQYIAVRRDRQRKIMEVLRNRPRGPEVDHEQVRADIEAKSAVIRDEFSTALHKFLPSSDAAKLVEEEGNSRWGRFGRGGDQQQRRRR